MRRAQRLRVRTDFSHGLAAIHGGGRTRQTEVNAVVPTLGVATQRFVAHRHDIRTGRKPNGAPCGAASERRAGHTVFTDIPEKLGNRTEAANAPTARRIVEMPGQYRGHIDARH